MSAFKLLRTIYMRSTNLTKGYLNNIQKLMWFYKWWSLIYDFSIRIDPAYSRQLQAMIKKVVTPDDRVLDIGCGTGIGTLYAAQIAKEVTGIDISEDMIKKLKRKINSKGIKNVQLIHGVFPNDVQKKYDTVVSSFAIVHVSREKRGEIYKGIYRLLPNGGKLGLFSAQGEVAEAFEYKDELYCNLEKNGFKNIEIHDVSDI